MWELKNNFIGVSSLAISKMFTIKHSLLLKRIRDIGGYAKESYISCSNGERTCYHVSLPTFLSVTKQRDGNNEDRVIKHACIVSYLEYIKAI